jgi:hypothetical protein
MEKTTLGLVAALSALAATPAAASLSQTATEDVLKPASIAELLEPIPNAVDVMQRLQAEGRMLAPVEVADDMEIGIPGLRFRRHHHHHHHYREHHHHHHHHPHYHHHHDY